MRTSLIVCVLLLTTACSLPGPRHGMVSAEQLLSGTDLSLPPLQTEPVTRADAIALDDEMRAFVKKWVGRTTQKSLALSQLVTGMEQRGFFRLEYVVGDTRTAQRTFHDMRGNCISFTLLFVALARESGLNVSYQIVDVPPVWSVDSLLMVIANHINVLIETPGRDYVMDFNETRFNARYPREKISDEYALALFFNNLGAEAMLRDDEGLALHYFREAIALEHDATDPWVNLGLLYARRGLHDHAEAAYLEALDIDPLQRSALTNLANLYDLLGETELAAAYYNRVRHYQQRNPFYHFAVAQQALAQDRLEDAVHSIDHAIRLKRDEQDFYYLLGITQVELGKYADAVASLEQGRAYATSDNDKARYDAALAEVRQESGTASLEEAR